MWNVVFPARSPVLSRWRRAFYSVKWRYNFYNLILPDKIPENRDPVKKILIASYGTITLPTQITPQSRNKENLGSFGICCIYILGDEWMAMTWKEGDDLSDDIIDYGSMRMALDCFKGKFRLNGDALLLPRPPLIECHPLGCCWWQGW